MINCQGRIVQTTCRLAMEYRVSEYHWLCYLKSKVNRHWKWMGQLQSQHASRMPRKGSSLAVANKRRNTNVKQLFRQRFNALCQQVAYSASRLSGNCHTGIGECQISGQSNLASRLPITKGNQSRISPPNWLSNCHTAMLSNFGKSPPPPDCRSSLAKYGVVNVRHPE
jgi:hypothetical protein